MAHYPLWHFLGIIYIEAKKHISIPIYRLLAAFDFFTVNHIPELYNKGKENALNISQNTYKRFLKKLRQ